MRTAIRGIIGRRPRIRLAVGVASAFAMLICGGAVATAPAMAAVTTTGVEHVCKQIGPEDQFANIAIVCTDLLKVDNGDGTFYSLGQTEAFCENAAAAIVRCANIIVSNQTAYQSGITTFVSVPTFYECGHAPNALCPAGRYVVGANILPQDPASCIPNTWGVTLGSGEGNSTVTTITLPQSDKPVSLSGNYGSPHASIGNC